LAWRCNTSGRGPGCGAAPSLLPSSLILPDGVRHAILVSIRARAEGAEVSIYDEIGAYGVSAKSFLDELGALPEDGPLTLRLNSPGGSVFDAVAIHNALRRHAGPVTVWIDGIAASAASYIAMSGDAVVMPQNAFLMIHDPSGFAMGTAEDMRAMAEALDRIKGSLVAGYAAKSGRSDDEIAALMTRETWLDAAEAVALGFADRIAARFDIGRFRNAPPALVAAIDGAAAAGGAGSEAARTGEAAAGVADPAEDGAESRAEEVIAEMAGSTDENTAGAMTGDVTREGPGDPACASAATAAGPPGAAGPRAQPGPHDPAEPAAEPAPTGPFRPAPDPAPAPEPAAIRTEARTETLAHAAAVIDLCALAGLPLQARRFLEAGASLDEVRAALLDLRADATPELTAFHPQPGRPADARPWGEVIARTFKSRG
jgi:ATP-dependent protease ClpP protease subunit